MNYGDRNDSMSPPSPDRRPDKVLYTHAVYPRLFFESIKRYVQKGMKGSFFQRQSVAQRTWEPIPRQAYVIFLEVTGLPHLLYPKSGALRKRRIPCTLEIEKDGGVPRWWTTTFGTLITSCKTPFPCPPILGGHGGTRCAKSLTASKTASQGLCRISRWNAVEVFFIHLEDFQNIQNRCCHLPMTLVPL